MKKFAGWLDKNHIAIVFTIMGMVAASAFFYFDLPKDVFPNGEFPRFQVIADIGFASLEETEINVTRPIEEALKTVPDVTEVRSITERGTSTIDIYLKWGSDLNQAFQFIQSKINQARAILPVNAGIDVVRMTTSTFPLSEYGIWSDALDQKELYTAVRYTILPKLIGIDGIYGLRVIGGEEPEIWIKLNPQKLLQFNLDAATIGTAVDNANKVSFVGNVLKDRSAFFVVGGSKLAGVEDIGKIVIATRMGKPVYLKDVATVVDFHVETRRLVSVNGHKGLFLDIQKQDNADSLKLSRQVDEKIAEIEREYNGRLNISKWDLSDFVANSIQGILFDILIGIIIILLIVYYVMNKFRYALPIILVLPIVIILEFLVLKILGLTVNIMTLGGLSAAIGIIADNAIVITENYVRFRGEGRHENSLAASMSYIVPITVWATVVSIIVFIPLNILSGVPGLFFRPLAITLATTIIVSLIMAILVIPVFIKYFIEGRKHPEDRDRFLFRLLKQCYLAILRVSLKLRWLVVTATIALIALGVFVFMRLPDGFLPVWDEGDLVFDYVLPTGTSIYGADEMCIKVEEIIKQIPEVKMYIRKTGTHLSAPFAPPTVGEIIILLNKDRKKTTFQIMDELREETAKKFPDIDTDFHQMLPDRLGDLTGVAKPIVINVIGNNLPKLWAGAQKIKSKLDRIQGLNGVIIDMPPAQKEIKVIPNQESVSLLGMGMNDVSHHARLALYGEVVSDLQRGLQTVPIRQFYEGDYRNDMEKIAQIPLYTPNGGILPLGKLASVTTVEQNPEIHHKNGSIVVNINAEISGRALSDIVKDIKGAFADIKSDNFTIELAGNYKSQQTSFMELLFVLLISIGLILAALLFIFESYRTAIAVFLGTLSSATFVIFGLYLSGVEFNVSSFTGMITVIGIVVNNGILVIDFVERFRRDGKTVREAIAEAGAIRFRPVLITNLAAIAGFLPMAFNIGRGGEVLQPFSIAMISGLIGSMAFSLIVMPVFYDILQRGKQAISYKP